MTVKSHPTEIYSLIARYLAGEASPADSTRVEQLVKDHPELEPEFEFFRLLLNKHDQRSGHAPFKNGFDRITKKLKDKGIL